MCNHKRSTRYATPYLSQQVSQYKVPHYTTQLPFSCQLYYVRLASKYESKITKVKLLMIDLLHDLEPNDIFDIFDEALST